MTRKTCLYKDPIPILYFFGKGKTLNIIKKAGEDLFFSGFSILLFFLMLSVSAQASHILIPMDAETRRYHLGANATTYWRLDKEVKVQRNNSFFIHL